MMTTFKRDPTYEFPDFDDTDDLSDDEVFVRDSKISLDDDGGVNRPLMPPRRKTKSNYMHTEVKRSSRYKMLWASICYGIIAFSAIIGIICLVIFLLNTFSAKLRLRSRHSHHSSVLDVIGCTNIEIEDVWVKNFPKLTTESAFRLNDVNSDGVPDIIIGFGTGADGYNIPSFVCDIYFDGKHPCFGGIMALEGKTGNELWRHYSDHEVFALNCNEDIDGDKVNDCLAGGRAGTFQAVSGQTGKLIWNFDSQEAKNDIMNLYTAQFIPDQNGDGVVDVLAVHGGDPLANPGSDYRLSGRILIFSGKDGKVLRWMGVPDQKESYYSPQLMIHSDGSNVVLFGTGGETHSGSLWYILLTDLVKGDINKARPIYKDFYKGIMTPPVFADVDNDGHSDIVMAMFNSTIIAFNGVTFDQIWNYTIPSSETYSTPAVGFYNDDDVPDFLVKYQIGPGFPIYYYSQTTVLDGVSGKPLLPAPVKDTIGSQASALSISMEGLGNDLFLYWTSDCLGHEGQSQEFSFVKGTNVHEQSHTDFCQVRFNSEMVTRLYVLSQSLKAPGVAIYQSTERKLIEYNNTVNTSALAYDYLRTHPDMWDLKKQYEEAKDRLSEDIVTSTGRSKVLDRDHYQFRSNDWKSPHSNTEQEEDVSYPRMHNIRKHGRYKNFHTLTNSDRRQSDSDYLDASSQEYDDPMEEKGMWRKNDERPWYKQHYANQDDSFENQRYQDSVFKNSKHRPSYHKNERKNYDRNRFTEDDDRDLDWNLRVQGDELSREFQKQFKKRFRRHVGPHDAEGIQRLISTGTLAPTFSLNTSDADHSIDLVFATYWFFPAKTQAILPEDRDCIQKMMSQEKQRFSSNSEYYGMDHDAYERVVTKDCVERNGHADKSNRTYSSQSDYDPFNIKMGQMTVYRLRLKCTCHADARVQMAGKKCARVLPFEQQFWAGYLGKDASSYYRRKVKQ